MLTIGEIQALRTEYAEANTAYLAAVQRSKNLSTIYAQKNAEVQQEIEATSAKKVEIEKQLREGVV